MPPDQPLTPDRLALLESHFDEAVRALTADRESIVAALEAADPELGGRLRGLLRAHELTGRVLERPLLEAAPFLQPPGDDPWIGARVGVYEIQREIGSGGMGTVYEAARADDQYRMRVAIKVLRQHASGDAALQRFRAERQILASLSHRNIAGLLDGGVTPDGQPYFVMEYVDGEPITIWCDNRRLPVRARLGLFRQVCAAVQYAHQSLVIHRDLKPGNIMVTGDGTVKLLDFGIAKLLPDPADPALGEMPATQVGARAYTPEYASPEQVLGDPVGTRSDVYALGVVLYELLTGRRPFDLQGKRAGEVERLVSEASAPRPSTALAETRIADLGERSLPRAQSRLAGDLDAIILKALRKEPERRYGSVEEFAADTLNHLEGRPVSARPDSLGYRLGKLVRRRRGETAAVVAAVVFLVGGMVTTTLQARAAERQRVRATEITGFLTTMLGAANPASFGREVQMREVLDSAVVRAAALGDNPDLQTEIQSIIGSTYLALGEFETAESVLRQAVQVHQVARPRGARGMAVALSKLSAALEFQGRYVEADSVLQLAGGLFGRFADDDGDAQADHLDARARILTRLGRIPESVPLLEEALAIHLRSTPVNDSSVAYAYTNLGVVTSELGSHVRAESLLVLGLQAARRAHGEVHPLVAAILSPLATVRAWAGMTAQADSTFQATIAMRRELLGPDHPDFAWTMFSYADFLVRHDRFPEAALWARKVLELRGESLADTHPAVSTAMQVLGRALGRMDSLVVAERWLRESWEIRKTHWPPGHFGIASSEGFLGEALALARQFPLAEEHLLASERGLVEARGEGAEIVTEARQRLVKLYELWERPEEAAAWRAKLVPAGR